MDLQCFARLSIILALLLVKLTFLLGSGILILLILGDQVVHVRLRLSELHLVHAFAGVPVQEGLASEHGREVLRNALEHFLDSCGVAGESHGHLQSLWWDVADGCLDVVGNPLHKVGGVLVLDIEHLLIHLFRGHSAAEECCGCQVSTVSRVCCAHHVLGIEHLLCQLRHGQGTVLLGSAGCQGCKAGHEEMQAWERHEVDGNLAQIAVELTWKSQAASHAAHRRRDQVVQVSISGSRQLQGPEANVVQCFIVQQEGFVRVLHQLVEA
mmetsp:Transcript_61669/g.127620  ORF Transcript_61669/g.127620 Transcript_61669/m.127620 type:complete len:268 (+) Transcript_61669:189-992(+)